MFFLGKCVRTAAKTIVVDRKYRKALALPCLMSEPLPNAANSSDVLRLDSMLRELRKLLCYDKGECCTTSAKMSHLECHIWNSFLYLNSCLLIAAGLT